MKAPEMVSVCVLLATLASACGQGWDVAKLDVQAANPADDLAADGDLPPVGRSLLDWLLRQAPGSNDAQLAVPFPFTALESLLAANAAPGEALIGTLVPFGRSLQKMDAFPEVFKFPRVVLTFDKYTVIESPQPTLFAGRFFLAYVEKSQTIEAISYNETAGRFEFQTITDYEPGKTPHVQYAHRAACLACHQSGTGLWTHFPWGETTETEVNAAAIREARGEDSYMRLPLAPGSGRGLLHDEPDSIEGDVSNGAMLQNMQRLWKDVCAAGKHPDIECRAALIRNALSPTTFNATEPTVAAAYARYAADGGAPLLETTMIPSRLEFQVDPATGSPVLGADGLPRLDTAPLLASLDPQTKQPTMSDLSDLGINLIEILGPGGKEALQNALTLNPSMAATISDEYGILRISTDAATGRTKYDVQEFSFPRIGADFRGDQDVCQPVAANLLKCHLKAATQVSADASKLAAAGDVVMDLQVNTDGAWGIAAPVSTLTVGGTAFHVECRGQIFDGQHDRLWPFPHLQLDCFGWDFTKLSQTLANMAADADPALTAQAARRDLLLTALLQRLGAKPPTFVTPPGGFAPPPQLAPATTNQLTEADVQDTPDLALFFHFCGECHAGNVTHNFLAGGDRFTVWSQISAMKDVIRGQLEAGVMPPATSSSASEFKGADRGAANEQKLEDVLTRLPAGLTPPASTRAK